MRKLFLFLIILCSILFVSCDKSDEVVEEENIFNFDLELEDAIEVQKKYVNDVEALALVENTSKFIEKLNSIKGIVTNKVDKDFDIYSFNIEDKNITITKSYCYYDSKYYKIDNVLNSLFEGLYFVDVDNIKELNYTNINNISIEKGSTIYTLNSTDKIDSLLSNINGNKYYEFNDETLTTYKYKVSFNSSVIIVYNSKQFEINGAYYKLYNSNFDFLDLYNANNVDGVESGWLPWI